jgi:mRNA interferase YafQ
MLTLNPSKTFRRELQRLAARGRDIVKILPPLLTLLNEQRLPRQYLDHPLEGEWTGHREFHVEPNWLVIYRIESGTLILVRTGTHSDLLKR